MMTEVWAPIEGFEEAYEVSSLGRVRSARRYRVSGRILRPSAAGNGYRKVALRAGEKRATRYVHHLVLEAFVGPRPTGTEACHRNGRRDENDLANLRWDTRSGNHADKHVHGTACVGERHGRRKLSAADVAAIRAATGTLSAIGERFGVGPMQIHRIKSGKNWKEAAHATA